MWGTILALAALSLLVNGTSLPLHNGTYVLQGGLVAVTSNGLRVAEFNSTPGVWDFRIYQVGEVVIITAASGVNLSLRGVWDYPFSNGLVAYVEACLGHGGPPLAVQLWQGTTPIQVPGIVSLVQYSNTSCGWLLSIDGNSSELEYLTYFNQYSWTTFEVAGANWTMAIVLGEAGGGLGTSVSPPVQVSGVAGTLGVGRGVSYIPLIVSTAALALALVVELGRGRGDRSAEVRQAGANLRLSV